MKKANRQNKMLNFFTITKKYWKEQLVFYILTTISFLGSWFVGENALKFAWNIIKKEDWKRLGSLEYKLTFGFERWEVYNFKGKMINFLIVVALIVIIYCLVVIIHVYYSFFLCNKIIIDIKKRIVEKIFRLESNFDEKRMIDNLVNDTKNFSDHVIYTPNQFYYMILEAFFALWAVYKSNSSSEVLWLGTIYILVIIIVSIFLKFILYKRDLFFRKQLEVQTHQEIIIAKNRDLIVKKGIDDNFQKKYIKILQKSFQIANKEDWIHTLSFVLPSYSLIKYSKFFFFPFIHNFESYMAFTMIIELFDALKKMIDRLKNYPYYFSAKKRLNEFLMKEERDDIQKNLIINEKIESIFFENISFSYENNKMILKKENLIFTKGKINHLQGVNGYGKSTIINLIIGLYRPNEGNIIINNKYKLSDLNLYHWRKKIAYAEHQNLVEDNLSTGQKQLVDLNETFTNSKDKRIFIFDEINALDKKSNEEFDRKIKNLVENEDKIVILVRH